MKKETEEVEFRTYLVIKDGMFFIEDYYKNERIDECRLEESEKWLTKILFDNNKPLPGRFELRFFTQAEKEEINKMPINLIDGQKKRFTGLQCFLETWMNNSLVLGAEEFNRISKSNRLTKPVVVLPDKHYPLYDDSLQHLMPFWHNEG